MLRQVPLNWLHCNVPKGSVGNKDLVKQGKHLFSLAKDILEKILHYKSFAIYSNWYEVEAILNLYPNAQNYPKHFPHQNIYKFTNPIKLEAGLTNINPHL